VLTTNQVSLPHPQALLPFLPLRLGPLSTQEKQFGTGRTEVVWFIFSSQALKIVSELWPPNGHLDRCLIHSSNFYSVTQR
jgi:hypothetical protein